MEQEYPNHIERFVPDVRDPQERQTQWGRVQGWVRLRYTAYTAFNDGVLQPLRNGVLQPLRNGVRVVDHVDYWTDGEHAIIVLEPYDLTDASVAACVKVADAHGWNVDTTRREASVWNPGCTQMLILWRPLHEAWLPADADGLPADADGLPEPD